jgi:hypothetical protein
MRMKPPHMSPPLFRSAPEKVGMLQTAVGILQRKSVDIYFGPTAPTDQRANWIRTGPGKGMAPDHLLPRAAAGLLRQDVESRKLFFTNTPQKNPRGIAPGIVEMFSD